MIDKNVWLALPPEAAFQLFTERISEWWPKTHRLTKDPESRLFLEPTGRFFERASDGREAELGRVVRWQAPELLELDFYMGTNAAQPTALEITFTSECGGTRIAVRHRAKPESEALWQDRAPVFDRSWDAVLRALSASVTGMLPSSG